MDVGNIIHANDTNGIVVVTQLKPISVNFTLPEQNLGDIQAQFAHGQLKVLAVDRDNKTTLDEGLLTVIDNQIDPTTGTIRMKATFPNPNLRLWPGQFANTRLLLTTRTNAIVVPASVVQRGPEGSYAFVVQDDMTVEMRPVKVAFIEKLDAVIDSGLQPGEKVVVDGQYKLQPGSQIEGCRANRNERPRHKCKFAELNKSRRRQKTRPGRRLEKTATAISAAAAIGCNIEYSDVHEHFRAFHPAADRHVAAHGGRGHHGAARLFSAADLRAAAGRFPHDPGHGPISRRQPGRDGFLGHHAAGTAIRPNQRTDEDDFDQFVREHRDHACNSCSTATSTPPAQDVQAAMNAASGVLPNMPNPPTYSKVNPADTPILTLELPPTRCRWKKSTTLPTPCSRKNSAKSPASVS